VLEFLTLPHVAIAAAEAGSRLVHVSSDAVFSGTAPSNDETTRLREAREFLMPAP
jgi:dTDP-4-dehydrorhamnose reductase